MNLENLSDKIKCCKSTDELTALRDSVREEFQKLSRGDQMWIYSVVQSQEWCLLNQAESHKYRRKPSNKEKDEDQRNREVVRKSPNITSVRAKRTTDRDSDRYIGWNKKE